MKYDVFISCKSDKYDMAEKVYDFLTTNGFNVFFAKNILKKIGSADYGDAIDEALDQSTHLIVFCTSASEVEKATSPYVHYEWSAFNNEQRSGRKNGNIITILKDVNVAELPFALRKFQSFSYDNFEDSLLSYVETQEHESRVNKDVSSEKGQSSSKATVIEGSHVEMGNSTNVSSDNYGYDNVLAKKEFLTEDKDTDEAIGISDPLDVILISAGTKKDLVADRLAEYGYSYSDAKGIVDCTPFTIKSGISELNARSLKKTLEEVGAKVEVDYTGSNDNKRYTVYLTSAGSQKLEVINKITDICKIDFKKANDLVDKVPSAIIESDLTRYEADCIKKALKAIGCSVKIEVNNFVDLGLPSGLLWATCNIGASKPEGTGDAFAWGEFDTKKEYSISNSKTYRKSEIELVRNSMINSQKLTPEFDVATKRLGHEWRMPTKEDFSELLENCKWTLSQINGVSGHKVESMTNGRWIFLPSTGYRNADDICYKDKGWYWSSSVEDNSCYAFCLEFNNVKGMVIAALRHAGLRIRPVRK